MGDRFESGERLQAWAAESPSPDASTLVSPLSDIHRALLESARLIEELTSTETLLEQARILAALEVWMFDELTDRLESIRSTLEVVSKRTSDAAG